MEDAVIVSFLEEDSDIHWLPLRLFTGGWMTVKHVFAIESETWPSLVVFFLAVREISGTSDHRRGQKTETNYS